MINRCHSLLDNLSPFRYIDFSMIYGGIAQLGERLNGIQEVSGSIPLISTTKTVKMDFPFSRFLYCSQLHIYSIC
jgi:hypothetical protein